MKDFKNGVSFYTPASVTIMFPEDDICCHHCPLLDREFSDRETRYFCKRTSEFIPAPCFMIGRNCPLDFKKEE